MLPSLGLGHVDPDPAYSHHLASLQALREGDDEVTRVLHSKRRERQECGVHQRPSQVLSPSMQHSALPLDRCFASFSRLDDPDRTSPAALVLVVGMRHKSTRSPGESSSCSMASRIFKFRARSSLICAASCTMAARAISRTR